MAEFSPTSNLLNYLNSIKDSAAYARAVDAWNASKAYLGKLGDATEPLGDARDLSDLKKRTVAKKGIADTTLRELGSKAVNGAKTAGRATLNLGRNALTGLGDLSLGTVGTVAAPALAGAGWALMTGSRWDNNGTTKQLANEMNQAFKAGLYVDDEGNYVDANTNEIVGPEMATKRIDAAVASDTPVASNTEEGYSYPSSGDPNYKVEPAPMEPLPEAIQAPSAPMISKNPLEGLSDLALADAVIRGKYGNGADRKTALGDRYKAVQALVNQKMSGRAPAPKASPKLVDIGNGVVYNPATDKAELIGTGSDQLRDQVF